jgi:glutamine cyclotransferase
MRAPAVLFALLLAACSSPSTRSSPSTSATVAGSPELTACNAPRDPQPAPTGEAITASIALECEAGAVAVGGDSVWVVPHLDRFALRVDPTTNSVIDRIPLGDRGPGAEIDATDDMVWASVSSPSYDLERLVRIDPTTGSVVASVDAAGMFPVIGAGSVWATGEGEVYRIDPATNSVAAVIEASDCWMITLDERAFCVGPSTSYSIDPIMDVVTPVEGAPLLGWPVIAVDGMIWVVHGESLRGFDPETGQIDADIKAPEATVWSLDGVVLDGALWATASSTNGPSDRLVRIDRQRMTIDCVLPTPTSEFGMTAGFGSIWLPVLRQPWLLRIDPVC